MKRAGFFVFSASGNTKRICKLFGANLENHGFESEYVAIRKETEVKDVSAYDVMCIAYPVHGFNAPQIVLNFAKTLPQADKKGYYIIKTSGEPLKLNDASSRKLKRILARRGYVFKGEFHYVMPYNMIFRHSDGMAALMWQAAQNTAPADAAAMAEGKDVDFREGLGAVATRFAFSVERRGIALIGKGFRVDKNKCINCGKCVKACPVQNITLKDGKFRFGGHCLGCTACSFNCPTNAINIGMLNGWKVNGAYNFGASTDGLTEKDVCRYCHKSYIRYFERHGIILGKDKK